MTADWSTLRALDRRAGTVKGTAFRAFKRLAPQLVEGRDFRVLTPDTDAASIERLRAAGAIYAASRNVVLLAPAAAARVLDAMRARG